MTVPGDPGRKIDYSGPGAPPAGAPGQQVPGQPYGQQYPGPGAPPPTAAPPGTTKGRGRGRSGIGYTTYVITVLIALLVILMVVFVLKNNQHVSIWLFGSTSRMSVAGALAASGAVGLVIGLLIGAVTQVRPRRRLRQLERANRR